MTFSQIIKTALVSTGLATFATMAHAQMSLLFEESGSDLTLTWSGSWDVDTQGVGVSTGQFISSTAVQLYQGSFGYHTGGFTTPFPWTLTKSASTYDGVFGFDANGVSGPMDFASGVDFTGYMTFANTTYEDLGLAYGSMGSFSGPSGTVNWSVGTSAVPEPSSYAALFGLAGLGFAASKRRRRNLSAAELSTATSRIG